MTRHRLHSVKRTFAVLLAVLMLVGLLPFSVFAAEFTDTADSWAKDVIDKWATEYGIIKGDEGGTFRPQDPIKRGEFAAILNRIMQYQTIATNNFTDLTASAWYYNDVLKVNAAGVTNGVGGGQFGGETHISREQAFVMLRRMFNIAEDATGLAGFSDAASVSSWAVAELGGMAKAGYVQGSDGKINPQGDLTRAEAVQALENIVKGIYSTAGTYTVDTDGIVIVNADGVTLLNSNIGALHVTQGIGADGNFTLKDSKVTDFIVTGGGEHSITIDGSEVVNLVVSVDSTNGNVRVHLSNGAEVTTADLGTEGQETILIENDEGTVIGTVTISAEGTVTVTGEVGNLVITGDNVKLVVDENAKIGSVTIEGAGAALDVAGTISDIVIKADNAKVGGTGKVENVTVESGSGNEITTPDTNIKNNSDSDVSIGDGKTVESGKEGTSTNTGSTDNSNTGSITPAPAKPTITSVTAVSDTELLVKGTNLPNDETKFTVKKGTFGVTGNDADIANFVRTDAQTVTITLDVALNPMEFVTVEVDSTAAAKSKMTCYVGDLASNSYEAVTTSSVSAMSVSVSSNEVYSSVSTQTVIETVSQLSVDTLQAASFTSSASVSVGEIEAAGETDAPGESWTSYTEATSLTESATSMYNEVTEQERETITTDNTHTKGDEYDAWTAHTYSTSSFAELMEGSYDVYTSNSILADLWSMYTTITDDNGLSSEYSSNYISAYESFSESWTQENAGDDDTLSALTKSYVSGTIATLTEDEDLELWKEISATIADNHEGNDTMVELSSYLSNMISYYELWTSVSEFEESINATTVADIEADTFKSATAFMEDNDYSSYEEEWESESNSIDALDAESTTAEGENYGIYTEVTSRLDSYKEIYDSISNTINDNNLTDNNEPASENYSTWKDATSMWTVYTAAYDAIDLGNESSVPVLTNSVTNISRIMSISGPITIYVTYFLDGVPGMTYHYMFFDRNEARAWFVARGLTAQWPSYLRLIDDYDITV